MGIGQIIRKAHPECLPQIQPSGIYLQEIIMKALELTGQKFGRLIVKQKAGKNKWGCIKWRCQCDCGNHTVVAANNLNGGHSKSCGCLNHELCGKTNYKHGHGLSSGVSNTYKSWSQISQRCNNPKNPDYKYYGARGIKVCEHWNEFKNFLADMGECLKGLTLDRKDNDRNYEPNNCRWATRAEQMRNSRAAKLNPLKVQIIKKLLKESKLTQKEIGDIFGVLQMQISKINLGKAWGDIIYVR